MNTELVSRYPWLPSLKLIFPDFASKNPIDFFKDIFKSKTRTMELILKFFKFSFENREEFPDYEIFKNENLTKEFYLVIKLILMVLDEKRITNRISNLYSKITFNELDNEGDANLYAIYIDLNLKIKYYHEPITYRVNVIKNQRENVMTHFSLHFTDYLGLSSNLNDEYRKLVNNALSNGQIFIRSSGINRLIQEFVRNKFKNNEKSKNSSQERLREEFLKLNAFKEIYDQILAEWELKKEDFSNVNEVKFKDGLDISPFFPPCLKEILLKAQEGQNLRHIERLFLVFFLHALEYPIDNIVDMFSTIPDFNRSKTQYQVNFAKTKGYIPHKCSSLKSLSLCMAEKYKDKLCMEGYYSKKKEEDKKVTHPLFYVRLQQFRASRSTNTNNNKKTKASNNENQKKDVNR